MSKYCPDCGAEMMSFDNGWVCRYCGSFQKFGGKFYSMRLYDIELKNDRLVKENMELKEEIEKLKKTCSNFRMNLGIALADKEQLTQRLEALEELYNLTCRVYNTPPVEITDLDNKYKKDNE